MDRQRFNQEIDSMSIDSFVTMLGKDIEGEDWQGNAKKAMKTLGQLGAGQLSVVGATRGNNIEKFSDIQIKCDGEVQGLRTLQNLVDNGHLKTRGIMSLQPNNRDPNVLTLTRLAQSMPQCVTLTLLEAEKNKVDMTPYIRVFGSSLPASFQTPTAAALPLGPKARSAHIWFSNQFSGLIGGIFNPTIYNQQMRQANYYKKLTGLMKAIENLENLNYQDYELNATLGIAGSVTRTMPLDVRAQDANLFQEQNAKQQILDQSAMQAGGLRTGTKSVAQGGTGIE